MEEGGLGDAPYAFYDWLRCTAREDGGPERRELRLPAAPHLDSVTHAHGRGLQASIYKRRRGLGDSSWKLAGGKSGWEGKPEEEAEEELSGASSQRGDEFVCPRLRLRPGLRNWELGLERHPWKWEVAALGL